MRCDTKIEFFRIMNNSYLCFLHLLIKQHNEKDNPQSNIDISSISALGRTDCN